MKIDRDEKPECGLPEYHPYKQKVLDAALCKATQNGYTNNGYTNVEFKKGDLECRIPIDDNILDVVM